MATDPIDIETFLNLRRQSPPPVVIDLRSSPSFQAGHLAGSRSIPWALIPEEAIFFAPKSSYLLVSDTESQGVKQTLDWFEQRNFSEVHYTSASAQELLQAIKSRPEELVLADFAPDQWLSQIEQVLELSLRPYLALDEGGLEVERMEQNKLFVRYTGACKSCGFNRTDTLSLIQRTLSVSLNHDLKVVAAKELN